MIVKLMSWFMYYLISGVSFFIGAGLVAGALTLKLIINKKQANIISLVFFIFGFSLVLVSATPLPLWFYAIWLISTLFWISQAFRKKPSSKIHFRIGAVCLILVPIMACVWEMFYFFPPNIPDRNFNAVYVVGDSVSAGLNRRIETPWPDILRERQSLKVVNLAQPGATLTLAREQAAEIPAGDSLIILEIGGNDIIAKIKPAQFKTDLEDLLASVQHPERTLVMFELPLLPFTAEYGRIQRSLAKKYDVILIPKRYFAGIICRTENTLDGIHLSKKGHQEMAAMVADLLW